MAKRKSRRGSQQQNEANLQARLQEYANQVLGCGADSPAPTEQAQGSKRSARRSKRKPEYDIDISAPVNGKVGAAKVVIKDNGTGKTVFSDSGDVITSPGRQRLANAAAKVVKGVKADKVLKRLTEFASELKDRPPAPPPTEQPEARKAADDIRATVLDHAAKAIRRPLTLVDGTAYAVAWLSVRVEVRQRTDPKTGEVRTYNPPLVTSALKPAVVRSDGAVFADGVPLPGVSRPEELGLELAEGLQSTPVPPDRAWSGAGVKRFIAGEHPDPAEVFRRIVSVVDTFMDFNRSFAPQRALCEMIACYIVATYFLDASNVAGYLWPNGDRGSGKTNLLVVVVEIAYLGQLILAGGSYASLRDLADYGATLAFDDAEGVMDVKRTDPDKRALLLAGNRRGATVTVKEPAANRKWVTRHINAFCPRLFSAIRLPDDVLASRSIVVPLVRSADPVRAKRSPHDPEAWPCDRRRLVDDLWAVGLRHLPELPAFDAEAARQAKLVGRDLEPWRGILGVALWLRERHGVTGLHDRMGALMMEYQKERGTLEDRDPVRLAIRALDGIGKEQGPGDLRAAVEFTAGELAKSMNTLAEQEELAEEGKSFTSARKVGWLLKRLRFKKGDRTEAARHWQTTLADIEALARSYGMNLVEEKRTFDA
jgi:hypothetical protein